MKPTALLDESKIVLGIPGSAGKAEVIRLVAAAALDASAELRERVAADILAREKSMTTGIGRGVAIPHARSSEITGAAVALGVSREGVDFAAVDGDPVHFVFLLVTAESDPVAHIRILASVAALLGDDEVQQGVLSADSAGAVLEILRAHGG